MNTKRSTWPVLVRRLAPASLAIALAACSSSPAGPRRDAGNDAGKDAGKDAGSTDRPRDAGAPTITRSRPVRTRSPGRRPPAPAACADAPPAAPTAAAAATLTVDVGTVVRPWNRFYEKTVASDHAHTVLCTAYGRNIQNALRKAHAQAGFQYVRFHALFDDDNAVYSEDAGGRAALRLVEHRRDRRRHPRRGDAAAGRDQLHPRRARLGPDGDAHPALVQLPVAQHQPADRRRPATGASGRRS